MEQPEGERGAQAINRALGLLRLFTIDDSHLSLTEICQRTGLTMPTAHRIARALQSNGFLVHDQLTGRYALGPAVVQLAFVVIRNNDTSNLVRITMPYLESLRAATGETVGLHVPTVGGRLCVAESESRHMMRMATGVGNILPWNAGAASKAMLAFMPVEAQQQLLASTTPTALTPRTILDVNELLAALILVRQDRYATSMGESVDGASAIAVPILDATGDVAGSINITGPSNRWSHRDMLAALPELESAVTAVESLLGRPATVVRGRERGHEPVALYLGRGGTF
jgi:DNA-binding IclR family transcriptional regulator